MSDVEPHAKAIAHALMRRKYPQHFAHAPFMTATGPSHDSTFKMRCACGELLTVTDMEVAANADIDVSEVIP